MEATSIITRQHKNLLAGAIVLPLLALLILGTPAWAAPVITLSPASGAIGTNVTISGTVFDSYKGDNIYVFFDDKEITGSPLIVNDMGTFAINYIIPGDASPGRHWIEARSDVTSTSVLAKSFFFVEEADIDLDVVDGPVGTRVNISGRGFYADRTVTIYYYNVIGEKLGTIAASPVGRFSYEFMVPYSTAGKHKVSATNAEGNSAEAEFEVLPSVALNLASAGPGELLNIRGTGFGYRIEVDVTFGIYPVAKLKTDEFGNFEVNFNIPEVPPNTYDVKAVDADGNLDKAKFITTAGVKLNQSSGPVGSRLIVRGSGFKVKGMVTIDYDKLRVATALTDNNGAFTAIFNVPASKSGEHVIIINDGEITRQLAFTVESEPPPAPTPMLPADGSETRAQAYFDWQDVTDPSQPVVYYLQLASDQNFSSLVLEKKDMTASEYSLTEEERLPAVAKDAPYYWRVKARDSASNESEWSVPRSFYISAPPAPVLQLPPSGNRAEIPLFFNWNSVTSLSPPVTYSLQVATDLSFNSIVLEQKDLTDSEYTLIEEKELPTVGQEAPYYWRVKARDSANNESEWSAPQSFYTKSPFTLPGWVMYVLIAIAVIVVGYLAFRVGRRTAYSPPD